MDRLLRQSTAIAALGASGTVLAALTFAAGYFGVIGYGFLRFFQIQDLVLLLTPAVISVAVGLAYIGFNSFLNIATGFQNAAVAAGTGWPKLAHSIFIWSSAALVALYFFVPHVFSFVLFLPLYVTYSSGKRLIQARIDSGADLTEAIILYRLVFVFAAILFLGGATAGSDIHDATHEPASVSWKGQEIRGRTLLLSAYGILCFDQKSGKAIFLDNDGKPLFTDSPKLEPDLLNDWFGLNWQRQYLGVSKAGQK